MAVAIDDLDRNILVVLQEDSSLPLDEIARRVGASKTPVWNRIRKMKASGLIRAEVAIVDPEKLVASAAMVYGDLLDTLYGRLDPTPADRVHVLEDGEDIVIGGGRVLTTVDSPGHAKHHLALHDSESGIIFAGDAVGVRLPDSGVLRPATPPPDFDLAQALSASKG